MIHHCVNLKTKKVTAKIMNRKQKELFFSVTAKDCDFQATKGSGPGGQHRNKVETAIRCIHKPSGAVGYACDEKSQHRNKRLAFGRMARSKKFQDWLRMEIARKTGELADIEKRVEASMSSNNLKIEIKSETGTWQIAGECDFREDR